MLRRSLVSIVVAAGLIVPAAASASATARKVTATGGGVTATLSYRGSVPRFRDVALTITRGARTLYRAPVSYRLCGRNCWPVTGSSAAKPLRIADLQGDGGADVLLNLYSGGAHCCSIAEVFAPSAALGGRYVLSASHDFGDPGYRLRRLGGRESFVTGDDSFAYAFTDFARSGLPLQILQLSDGRFADVTRRFDSLVHADAMRWLIAYLAAHGTDNVGFIAAWAADECTLGRSRFALSYVASQARAGDLNSGLGRAYEGQRFVGRLRAVLRREGYLS